MPFHPASDKGTQRTYAQATSPGVVEGIPRNGAADSLPLILLSYHGVQEDDGVVC